MNLNHTITTTKYMTGLKIHTQLIHRRWLQKTHEEWKEHIRARTRRAANSFVYFEFFEISKYHWFRFRNWSIPYSMETDETVAKETYIYIYKDTVRVSHQTKRCSCMYVIIFLLFRHSRGTHFTSNKQYNSNNISTQTPTPTYARTPHTNG